MDRHYHITSPCSFGLVSTTVSRLILDFMTLIVSILESNLGPVAAVVAIIII